MDLVVLPNAYSADSDQAYYGQLLPAIKQLTTKAKNSFVCKNFEVKLAYKAKLNVIDGVKEFSQDRDGGAMELNFGLQQVAHDCIRGLLPDEEARLVRRLMQLLEDKYSAEYNYENSELAYVTENTSRAQLIRMEKYVKEAMVNGIQPPDSQGVTTSQSPPDSQGVTTSQSPPDSQGRKGFFQGGMDYLITARGDLYKEGIITISKIPNITTVESKTISMRWACGQDLQDVTMSKITDNLLKTPKFNVGTRAITSYIESRISEWETQRYSRRGDIRDIEKYTIVENDKFRAVKLRSSNKINIDDITKWQRFKKKMTGPGLIGALANIIISAITDLWLVSAVTICIVLSAIWFVLEINERDEDFIVPDEGKLKVEIMEQAVSTGTVYITNANRGKMTTTCSYEWGGINEVQIDGQIMIAINADTNIWTLQDLGFLVAVNHSRDCPTFLIQQGGVEEEIHRYKVKSSVLAKEDTYSFMPGGVYIVVDMYLLLVRANDDIYDTLLNLIVQGDDRHYEGERSMVVSLEVDQNSKYIRTGLRKRTGLINQSKTQFNICATEWANSSLEVCISPRCPYGRNHHLISHMNTTTLELPRLLQRRIATMEGRRARHDAPT